jgi:hypothetical protein
MTTRRPRCSTGRDGKPSCAYTTSTTQVREAFNATQIAPAVDPPGPIHGRAVGDRRAAQRCRSDRVALGAGARVLPRPHARSAALHHRSPRRPGRRSASSRSHCSTSALSVPSGWPPSGCRSPFGMVDAVRLAKPSSCSARRCYGPTAMARSQTRFGARHEGRRERLRTLTWRRRHRARPGSGVVALGAVPVRTSARSPGVGVASLSLSHTRCRVPDPRRR